MHSSEVCLWGSFSWTAFPWAMLAQNSMIYICLNLAESKSNCQGFVPHSNSPKSLASLNSSLRVSFFKHPFTSSTLRILLPLLVQYQKKISLTRKSKSSRCSRVLFKRASAAKTPLFRTGWGGHGRGLSWEFFYRFYLRRNLQTYHTVAPREMFARREQRKHSFSIVTNG